MKTFLYVFVLCYTILATEPFLACAQDGDMGNHEERYSIEAMARDLNLSPEQITALTNNKNYARERQRKLRIQIHEQREQLRRELGGETLNMTAIDQTAADLKRFQQELLDHRIDSILTVKEILTPEQFKQFQQLTKKRFENSLHQRQQARHILQGERQAYE